MKTKILYFFTIFSLTLGFSTPCLSGSEKSYFALLSTKLLETGHADPADVRGTFSVIFYGGRFLDDIETIAIFDIEGDPYHFEPFAPDFDYSIKKGVSAKKALEEARKFISFHHAFHKSVLSRIIDANGNTIGYELRPLYQPIVYGVSDVVKVHYWLKEGGRVKVTIRLIPELEKFDFPGGPGDGNGGD